MRTLLLLRHAKSTSDAATLADFDRPLSAEGERVTPIIGRYLNDTIGAPDLVLCSAAVRARQTWEHMAGCFAQTVTTQISRDLYLASAEGLLDAIRQAPGRVQRQFVVAHNPGIRQLAIQLSGTGDVQLRTRLADRFPTGAIAEIALEVDDWRDTGSAAGDLRRFITPTQLAP